MKSFFRRAFGGAGGPSAAGVLIFAALLSVYANCVTNSRSLELKYSLYRDVSNIYWIQAFYDRSLFPGDGLAVLNLEQMKISTEGFWVRLTAFFMRTTPCTYGLKLLFILACVAAALCVRRLAEKSAAGSSAGMAAVLFSVLFLAKDTFFGVPRVYGALIFLGFALAAEERRFLLLPFLAALEFAVYPAEAVLLAVSAALAPFFFREDFAGGRLRLQYLAALAAGGALCLFVLSHSTMLKNAACAFGSGFGNYKFSQMVPASLNPLSPKDVFLQFFLNLNEDGPIYGIFAGLLAAACAAGFALKPGRPRFQPRSMALLLAGSVVAFAALYPVHPVSASRQTIFIIPLALVFLACEALGRLSAGRVSPAVQTVVCAGLFAALHPWFGLTSSCRGYSRVYEYLSGLPKNAVIACYPGGKLAETVPLFSRRRTFLADDFYDQYVLRLNDKDEFFRKRKALLEALYGGKTRKLAEDFGVGYLVFEKRNYEKRFADCLRSSASALDREASPEIGGSPEKTYEAAREKAVFTWGNGKDEGFVLAL